MVRFGTPRPREVFVLGAGFSRAISKLMPLTDELGKRLAEDEPELFGSIGSRSFEFWLSQRAEPQPYLSRAGNLQNQALFTVATRLIARALDWSVASALSEPMPTWLGELVSLWHLRESDVVSFNYDPLIECAFETMGFWDWRAGTHFQWGSLLNYNPTGIAGASIGEVDRTTPPHRSFRLWKLHGSTNWYWAPGDTTGASALRVDLPGTFGRAPRLAEDDEHWRAPGRERLLVPPSALKSPYYVNPVTRETWARAYEALSSAQVITLVGYSLPATDLTTVGMLVDAAERGLLLEVRVVDYAPDPIVERLRAILPDHVRVTAVGSGEGVVARYVAEILADAGRACVADLLDRDPGAPDPHLVVTWGDRDRSPGEQVRDWGRTAAIVGIGCASSGKEATLIASETTSFEGAVSVADGGPKGHLRLSRLLEHVADGSVIKVRTPDSGEPATIIATAARQNSFGAGDGHWLQLVPAGCHTRTS